MQEAEQLKKDQVSKVKLYLAGTAFTLSVGFLLCKIRCNCPLCGYADDAMHRYVAALIGVAVWIAEIAKSGGHIPRRKSGRPRMRLYQTAAFYILFMIFRFLPCSSQLQLKVPLFMPWYPSLRKILGRIILGEKSEASRCFL